MQVLKFLEPFKVKNEILTWYLCQHKSGRKLNNSHTNHIYFTKLNLLLASLPRYHTVTIQIRTRET